MLEKLETGEGALLTSPRNYLNQSLRHNNVIPHLMSNELTPSLDTRSHTSDYDIPLHKYALSPDRTPVHQLPSNCEHPYPVILQVDGNLSCSSLDISFDEYSIPTIVSFRENPVPCVFEGRRYLKTIRRSNKRLRTAELPTVLNINPRSCYGKLEELWQVIDLYSARSLERGDKIKNSA